MNINNKENELIISVTSTNEKMQYEANCDTNDKIQVDYLPPWGDGKGYTSLELLLISLSSCIMSTVGAMLKGKNKKVEQIKGKAHGYRSTEHPKGFKSIKLCIELHSNDIKIEEVEKVLEIAEKSVCPVWNMMDKSIEIEVDFKIVKVFI